MWFAAQPFYRVSRDGCCCPPSTSKAYLCLVINASIYLDWKKHRLVLKKRSLKNSLTLAKMSHKISNTVILKSIYEWPPLPQLQEAFLGENESTNNTIQKVLFFFLQFISNTLHKSQPFHNKYSSIFQICGSIYYFRKLSASQNTSASLTILVLKFCFMSISHDVESFSTNTSSAWFILLLQWFTLQIERNVATMKIDLPTDTAGN